MRRRPQRAAAGRVRRDADSGICLRDSPRLHYRAGPAPLPLRKTGFCPVPKPVTLPAVGISARQFDQMRRRLCGASREVAPVFRGATVAAAPVRPVILGIDPSLRGTGYGVVRAVRPTPVTLGHGTIRCPASWARSRCLVKIVQELREVIRRHAPTICVVEGLFYAQNLQTALVMGEARGASLVAAAEAGLDIFEVAPRKVKQAIVGYGGAQKLAVAKMVQRLLGLAAAPAPDAADALALALTYAQEHGRYSLSAPKRV